MNQIHKVLVIGGTGLVGKTLVDILLQEGFTDVANLTIVASTGRIVELSNGEFTRVITGESLDPLFRPEFIFNCSSPKVMADLYSKLCELYPDACIIDNSSHFRMHPGVDIIIPPVNGHLITPSKKLYTNSNCVVSGLVIFLSRLCTNYTLNQVQVSTYQSVSGSGYGGIGQLQREMESGPQKEGSVYPKPIFNNVIPYIGKSDVLRASSEEETKIVEETRKILNIPDLDISATCVRVPVMRGHSMSVAVIVSEDLELDLVRRILTCDALHVVDDLVSHQEVIGKPETHVSRLRINPFNPKHLMAFITLDNLYRGAGYNSYEIANSFSKKFFFD